MTACMIDLVRYLRPKEERMARPSIIFVCFVLRPLRPFVHGQFLVVNSLPLTFGHVLATM